MPDAPTTQTPDAATDTSGMPFVPPADNAPAAPSSATGATSSVPQPNQPRPEPAATYAPGSDISSATGQVANVRAHKGALAGILSGALKGLETAGRVASLGGYEQYKATKQAVNLEMQKRQQDLIEQQQRIKQTETKSIDEHTESLLRNQQYTMQNTAMGLEMKYLPQRLSMMAAEDRNNFIKAGQEFSDQQLQRLALYKHLGADIHDMHVADGGDPFANMGKDQADMLTKGGWFAVYNGEQGDKFGFPFLNAQQLAATPLTEDVTIPSAYAWDAKKGQMVATETQTLQKGKGTLLDVVVGNMAGDMMYDRAMGRGMQSAKMAGEEAGTQEKLAQGRAQDATASMNMALSRLYGAGTAPGTVSAVLPQFLQSIKTNLPQPVQAMIDRFSPNDQALILRGAYGFVDPATFPNQLRKGSLGPMVTRAEFEGIANLVNPPTAVGGGYNSGLFDNMNKTQQWMTTGDGGASIRSFGQFLQHADTAKQVSNTYQRSNSPLWNATLNDVRTKFKGQAGALELETAVTAARHEWNTMINSGYKPDADAQKNADVLLNDNSTVAQINGVLGLMGEQASVRLGEINDTWKVASHGQNWPSLLDPSAYKAAVDLGLGDIVSKYPTGGDTATGPIFSSQNPPPTVKPGVVPPGKTPLWQKSTGKKVGYQDPDGKNRVLW
jgi:hypothetical protein